MDKVVFNLIDYDRNGNPNLHGLNWGNRQDGTPRDKNEAYLQLPPDIYNTDFFPPKGKYFIVETDDNQTLILVRAQKPIGTALQTPENNAILGKYLRNRLGINDSDDITKEAIENYRINITFYKKDELHYLLDFSKDGKVLFHEKNKSIPHPHNRIIFGAPGTGKSYKLEKEASLFTNQKIDEISIDMIREDWDSLSKNPNNKKYQIETAMGFKYADFINNLISESPSYQDVKKKFEIDHNNDYLKYAASARKIIDEKDFSKFNDKIIKSYERVTFHPNYSYAQFVGTYKPVSRNNNGQNEISYEYVPGPFIKTWIRAYKSSQPQLLLIEEINRANVAAVFGDVFQLLDRDENGNSEYPITISEDLKRYLSEKEKIDVETISIPANMYIWATMNSADQGVLPMDAAFKRRWDFEYIGIDENEDKVADIKIPVSLDGKKSVLWNDFRKKLNEKLSDELKINEDKLLGPFFLSKKSLENAMAEPERFVKLFESKVIMYLFEDVVKMQPAKLFKCDKLRYSEICKEFESKGMEVFGIDVEVLDI